jgi:hypothetical protein
MFSVSPDGRHLVFAAELDGVLRLWARTMVRSSRNAAGHRHAAIIPPVVWSPTAASSPTMGGVVKKKPGWQTPQTVRSLSSIAVGGAGIVTATFCSAMPWRLVRCPASGGPATPVTVPEDRPRASIFPSFLSDGRGFIISAHLTDET